MQPCCLPASLMLVTGLFLAPARAAIMTFDLLPGNFGEIPAYTEDGITLFAVDGPPEHFHDDINFVNGTVGATIFSSDGTPQRMIFDGGGQPFTLDSLEVWDIDAGSGPISFTSSLGAAALVSMTGTILFGPGFSNILFVQIDIPDPANDRFIAIDNIVVNVTEPATLAVLGLGICGIPMIGRRRKQGD